MPLSRERTAAFIIWLEVKVSLSVRVTYTFNDSFERVNVIREEAIIDPFTEKSAYNPAEVFMSWVAQETSAVSEHSDEARQITQTTERA